MLERRRGRGGLKRVGWIPLLVVGVAEDMILTRMLYNINCRVEGVVLER